MTKATKPIVKPGPAKRKGKAAPRVKAGTTATAAAHRRAVFIEAYLANGRNATEAAITAGFSVKTAGSQGSRLLKDVKTQALIAARTAELGIKIGLTTERTLREVARLAYSDPRKFYNDDGSIKKIHELDDDAAATIASVEIDELRADGKVIGTIVKLKQWDKNSALEKAMKFHGLYKEDNSQRVDPIRDILLAMGGKSAFAVVKDVTGG